MVRDWGEGVRRWLLAVERDSKFLCDIKVMDYSLLVGKDETTNELVVGIIDYLRPFSIDKVIESQVKSQRFKKRLKA